MAVDVECLAATTLAAAAADHRLAAVAVFVALVARLAVAVSGRGGRRQARLAPDGVGTVEDAGGRRLARRGGRQPRRHQRGGNYKNTHGEKK